MKKFALAALLTFLSVFALTQETQAGGLRLGITAGRVNVQVGGVVFSNYAGRLVPGSMSRTSSGAWCPTSSVASTASRKCATPGDWSGCTTTR